MNLLDLITRSYPIHTFNLPKTPPTFLSLLPQRKQKSKLWFLYARTASAWTYYLFQKFQNAIFFGDISNSFQWVTQMGLEPHQKFFFEKNSKTKVTSPILSFFTVLVWNPFLVQLRPWYFQRSWILYRSTTGKILVVISQSVFKWDHANQFILTEVALLRYRLYYFVC